MAYLIVVTDEPTNSISLSWFMSVLWRFDALGILSLLCAFLCKYYSSAKGLLSRCARSALFSGRMFTCHTTFDA